MIGLKRFFQGDRLMPWAGFVVGFIVYAVVENWSAFAWVLVSCLYCNYDFFLEDQIRILKGYRIEDTPVDKSSSQDE